MPQGQKPETPDPRGETDSAPPPSGSGDSPAGEGPACRLRKLIRTTRGSVAVAAAVMLALALCLVVAFILYDETRGKPPEPRRQSYIADITRAAVNLEAGNDAEAHRRLEACPEEFRGWEWYHLRLKTGALLMTLEDNVSFVGFSPDGERIVSASGDGSIRLWDAKTGKLLHVLAGLPNPAGPVSFTPDGKRIVSGFLDGTVRVWDADTGEVLATRRNEGERCLAVAPDGRFILSVSDTDAKSLWLRNTDTGDVVRRLESPKARGSTTYVPTRGAFSPDGKLVALAIGRNWRVVSVWNVETGEHRLVLRHRDPVHSAAFGPKGKRIVTAGRDGTLRLWDARDGNPSLLRLEGHGSAVYCVAFSPDGERIASGSRDHTVRLWDAATGIAVATLGSHEGRVTAVAFSPDGRRIVSGSYNNEARLWDAGFLGAAVPLFGHEGTVFRVAFSPDGKRIISGGNDGRRVWDAESGELLRAYPFEEGVRFSTDMRWKYSRIGKGGLEVRDVQSGELLVTLTEPQSRRLDPGSLQVSRDRKLIVGTTTGHIRIESGRSEHVPARLYFLNGENGNVMATVEGPSDCAWGHVAIHPDSQRVAAVCGFVGVWDSSSGKLLASLKAAGGPLAFSADGNRIVSSSERAAIGLWDAATGEQLRLLRGHEENVTSVAFSPDGGRIVSASVDNTLRIWAAESGEALLTLPGRRNPAFPDWFYSVAFSPDGKRIVSGSRHGDLRVWESEFSTARRMWEGRARGRFPEAMVERLFREHVLPDRVVSALQTDERLDLEQRELAIRLAQARRPPNAHQLNRESWKTVVCSQELSADDYLVALRKAEVACELEPENFVYLTTLGIARYRAGRFKEALATLRNAYENGDEVIRTECRPFIAMCHYRVGDADEARKILAEVRATESCATVEARELVGK